MQDLMFKIIVIGDSSVGKTNILLRFCEEAYKPNYVATIGVDFKVKTIMVDDTKVKFQIWDTAGQQRYKQIIQTYYKGASGVVLAYSVDDRESFEHIENWIRQIGQHVTLDIPKILVGNKCDLNQRVISTKQGEKIAQKYRIKFFQTSAKDGTNINNVFQELGRRIIQDMNNKQDILPSVASFQSMKLTDTCAKTKYCKC